ncbi:DUF4272 domain-containing protein [Sorangium sp. So ce1024]|uniref:DUF4272 domain-containing protein n=1 Tax=Sorangium sp. So ce1024 TaxID=3133327 RepID=UPI003F0E021D
MQAYERRRRSEQRLTHEGVQAKDAPPALGEDQVRLRSTEEALWRALCLGVVGMYGDGLDRETTLEEVERWGLWPHFTPEEAALLRQETVDGSTLSTWSWHQEGAFALMWALGLLDELGAWDPEQTGSRNERLFSFSDLAALQSAAQLRPLPELLDEQDYYALYQAAYEPTIPPGTPVGAEAELGPIPAPAVRQRLDALRWLLGSGSSNAEQASRKA